MNKINDFVKIEWKIFTEISTQFNHFFPPFLPEMIHICLFFAWFSNEILRTKICGHRNHAVGCLVLFDISFPLCHFVNLPAKMAIFHADTIEHGVMIILVICFALQCSFQLSNVFECSSYVSQVTPTNCCSFVLNRWQLSCPEFSLTLSSCSLCHFIQFAFAIGQVLPGEINC